MNQPWKTADESLLAWKEAILKETASDAWRVCPRCGGSLKKPNILNADINALECRLCRTLFHLQYVHGYWAGYKIAQKMANIRPLDNQHLPAPWRRDEKVRKAPQRHRDR